MADERPTVTQPEPALCTEDIGVLMRVLWSACWRAIKAKLAETWLSDPYPPLEPAEPPSSPGEAPPP